MKLKVAQFRVGGLYACNRKANKHKNIPQPNANNNILLIIKDSVCIGEDINFHAHQPNIKHPIINNIRIHTNYENH